MKLLLIALLLCAIAFLLIILGALFYGMVYKKDSVKLFGGVIIIEFETE